MGKTKQDLLLDTQIVLWWMDKDQRLPPRIKELIHDSRREVYVSVISLWEMLIKKQKGKLDVPANVDQFIVRSGFILLPLVTRQVVKLKSLPMLHKDPFDRMLICQALSESFSLVTVDKEIRRYKLPQLKIES